MASPDPRQLDNISVAALVTAVVLAAMGSWFAWPPELTVRATIGALAVAVWARNGGGSAGLPPAAGMLALTESPAILADLGTVIAQATP